MSTDDAKQESSKQFLVKGVVRDGNNGPLADVVVRAYDKDLRKQQELGEKRTDPQGRYAIWYSQNQFCRAEKGKADIFIIVSDSDDQELKRSATLYNAPDEAVIDIVVSNGRKSLSEFERNIREIEPLLVGQGDGDQDITIDQLNHDDITPLGNETGIPGEQILALVYAVKAAKASGSNSNAASALLTHRPSSDHRNVPVEAFYGWFRQGLSSDLTALWSRKTSELLAELKKSIEANIVPYALTDQLSALEATLNQLGAARALEPAPKDKPSSLGDLLRTLPNEEALSNDQQLTFARLHDEYGETDELWEHAGASGLANAVPALKRTFELGQLTASHPSLILELQKKVDMKRPDSVEFLTRLKPTDWIELVFQHGVPPGSGLDQDAYIDQLQAEVESRFPTQMLIKQFAQPLPNNNSFAASKVRDFLGANPDFDFKSGHVEPYLRKIGNGDDDLRRSLLSLQRVDALTKNSRETGVLLDAGIGSATQLVSMGYPLFASNVGGISPDRKKKIYGAAEKKVALAIPLAIAYGGWSTLGNATEVVPAPSINDEVRNKYPSLQVLFGDLDYCECQHCQSVLGPAAYLTDLLHLLQRFPLKPHGYDLLPANYDHPNPDLEIAAQGTVLGALLQRRPDLADLELSCENTNTEIPYIDLVLEILENAVGLPLVKDTEAPPLAGIDIDAQFNKGQVPEAVADVLRETDVKIGDDLTVRGPHSDPLSPFLHDWIIKDGSRRWLIQLQKQELILKNLVPEENSVKVLDVKGAVESLEQGKLSAEIVEKLSSEVLPIDGTPQIQDRGTLNFVRRWRALYNRAVVIEMTRSAQGSDQIEWFTKDGTTRLHNENWQPGEWQKVTKDFIPGKVSRIAPYVAQRLHLPVNETYTQTRQSANRWELRTSDVAQVQFPLGRLIVGGLTYQNSSIHEDLKATPENRNPSAYNKLSNPEAVFPWTLPFDLWLEETRAFLDALGIPRANLIDLARPQSRLSDLSEDAVTFELLGLSKAEADLIVKATPAEPWTYWGLTEKNNTIRDNTAGSSWKGDWLGVLAHLSMLLQQSALTYREYLDLLQTAFVGNGKPTLFPEKSGLSYNEYLDMLQKTFGDQSKAPLFPLNECKTSNITLEGLNVDQLKDHLQRIHVFTRLWRKSGWGIQELDLALVAFGGSLTQAILKDFALLKRLEAALGLPVSAVIGCVDKLNTQAWTDYVKDGTPVEPALYDKVFQRQSLRSLSGFDDFASEKLEHSTLKISERADFIAASLGAKPADVKAWVTATNGPPSLVVEDAVKLDNLSRLYAAALLCRTLQIAPDTLPYIVVLLDQADAFGKLSPAPPMTPAEQTRARARALVEFTERVSFVKESGFDFGTLGYLLQHKLLPGASDASTKIEQQLAQTLTELRTALQSQSTVVLGDVSADNVKRQLARLGWYPALIDAAIGPDGLDYLPGASVEIPVPAQEPVISFNLRSKFNYRKLDANKAVLECTGSLVDADFNDIDAVFPGKGSDLKQKYNADLKNRIDGLAYLMRAFELPKFEKVVNLQLLPMIPADFIGRVGFEWISATIGKVTLRGWFSIDEKKKILDANPGDAVLSGALDDLQTQAQSYQPTEPFITSADAEQLLREPDLQERYRKILLRLVSRLNLDVLTSQLSVALSLEPQVVAKLLDAAKTSGKTAKVLLTDSSFLSSDPKSLLERKTFRDQFTVLELLFKAAKITDSLKVTPEQWDWLLDGIFTIIDVLSLPTSNTAPAAGYDGWRKLVDLFHLRDVLPDGAKRVGQVHDTLKTSDFAELRKVMADAFELLPDQAVDACGATLLDFKVAAKDYNNPSRLLELAKLLHVIKLLGTTADTIQQLINSEPKQPEADIARQLFAASIDSSAVPERLRPISDRLRNLQRNALVAYLVQTDHLADSNELFDRYLIDVEMGSCMLTSRIKQAISSVQLFVQRCLLNLEQPAKAGELGVSPVSIDTQRWQWMKYYRVWEANRKIFLWPEIWIEPELRDDKSELFRGLESDLLQSELTHDTALLAFRKYADGLGDLARLTVVSMFDEKDGDHNTLIHIIGRDNSQPYKHYYRQWRLGPTDTYGNWTPWEEVSTQIDSEHVIVFVHAGSIHLAWPTISKKQTELQWNVRMNLARRNTGGWTKLKRGRGELSSTMVPNKDESRSFVFRFVPEQKTKPASIECSSTMYQWQNPRSPESKFSQVPSPRSKRNVDSKEENPLNRTVSLSVRVLTKYTDASGAVYFANTLDSATITATLYYNAKTVPFFAEQSFAIGTLNNTKLELKLPLTHLSDLFEATVQNDIIGFNAIKLQAKITGDKYVQQDLESEIHSLERDVDWNIDFIFEIKDDWVKKNYAAPTWGANRNLLLGFVGRFQLMDDGSLDAISGGVSSSPPESLPPASEYIDSGYREIFETSPTGQLLEHPWSVDGVNIIDITPGNFLVFRTAQESEKDESEQDEYWAYRDDVTNLILWKSHLLQNVLLGRVRTKPKLFRMVPMTVAGTKDLRDLLSANQWEDVANLPDEFHVTAVSDEHGTVSHLDPFSKLNIEIGFENLPSSSYYWEVFFHIPLIIATQLSKGQRFDEAQRWFHLIFDPTTNNPKNDATRYWRFKPFRDNVDQRTSIEQMLTDLAQGKLDMHDQIEAWAKNPFRPHLIARHRYRAYQISVVLKYLENLIAWGDQLFRRDTIESINEATQLYVLAAKILGKRPTSSPGHNVSAESYRDVQAKLDDFSNAWISWEPLIASQNSNGTTTTDIDNNRPGVDLLKSIGNLYFCVPYNEKLSEYWDTVEDRLFKIRHCMNIDGIERQLPLFEPPIDPALLVKATAAGLDLASILSGMDAPLPLYRFNLILQKALDLCGEVRSLGSALLSALEKKDAEQLSLLRSSHEIQILKLVRGIKEQQQKEAEANLDALQKTREVTAHRYLHYQRLMGKQNILMPVEGAPAVLGSSALQLAAPSAGDTDTQGLALIQAESDHMGWLNQGNNYSITAGIFNTVAGTAHMLPDFTIGEAGTYQVNWGGSHVGSSFNAFGSLFTTLASNANFQATRSSIIGGHQRRYDEWQFQSNSAAKELEQIDKQIAANKLRVAIAESEISNHDQQIENTQEVDDFMRDKFSNQQLYSWMVGQISGVYFRTYQLAYDMSKRAEACYRHELGLQDSNFIQFGYWDSLKKGLLCGESLHHDLKRLEIAYLDQNKREFEITKHVSLMQLDPLALLNLKETYECYLSLPEALFDLDYPGHYMRRIKSVSITIPCVTGPYTNVNCTLTLLKSSLRIRSTVSGGKYARDLENDDSRFVDSFGAIQSIVTSSAQNDSGMFETNLHDERYLPFEGAGVISNWRIQLPKNFRQFDYETISDVILHVRYTARDGGAVLRDGSSKELQARLTELMQLAKDREGLWRLFSLRHDFPNEFHRLLNPPAGSAQSVELKIGSEHFPYFLSDDARNEKLKSTKVTVYLKPMDKKITTTGLDFKVKEKGVGQWAQFINEETGETTDVQKASCEIADNPISSWKIESSNSGLKKNEVEDILILLNYTI